VTTVIHVRYFDLVPQYTDQFAEDSSFKLVIFDFDGTLADSLPWLLDAFDQVADRYRFKRLERGEIDELRHFGARHLLAHHRVPTWKLPLIMRHLRSLMRRDIATIRPIPGVEEALRALAAKGIELGLLTSNSRENVTRVLGPETSALFRYWECGSSLFGKTARLRKLLRVTRYARDEVIFLGDEIRDAEAARGALIPFGAVAWGFTHLSSLATYDVAETFVDAKELVEKLAHLRRAVPSLPEPTTDENQLQMQVPAGGIANSASPTMQLAVASPGTHSPLREPYMPGQ
jgi:phosphoglycolate phosphatase